MNDLISRHGVSAFLDNMGHPMLADIVMDKKRFPSAQPERIQNNAVHLCDSCQHTYVTCPSHGNDAVFGDGKGNDNICACNKYRPISAQPERPEQPESARKYCAECDHIEMCRWYPYEGCDFRSLPSAQPVDKAYLCDWFINSVGGEPTWTEEHVLELVNDFYVIPKEKR